MVFRTHVKYDLRLLQLEGWPPSAASLPVAVYKTLRTATGSEDVKTCTRNNILCQNEKLVWDEDGRSRTAYG